MEPDRPLSTRAALRQVMNPPNPWISTVVEHLGPPPEAALEVFFDSSRQALSKNDSPDIPFTWSVNPYRGCYHGCAYCYARPTHQYLDFGAGTDFERKLVVKREVATLLRDAFEHPRWRGELVVFSGNTDCYQPLEATWQLTRQCLQVCLAYRNPVGIITKSTLIERDLELLSELARETFLTVTVSLPFRDADVARAMEPYVPTPERRLKTIERLAKAGIAVGINVAPLIPGLNDQDVERVLGDARSAGAVYANRTMLRLPGPVKEVFEHRLRMLLPLRADKVMNQIREARDGQLNESRFGDRMRGSGPRWRMIDDLFKSAWTRYGYSPMPEPPPLGQVPFRRPERPRAQLELFG
ncbi:MAG: PA0069 family radical SAM protein [Deltaproteobacteria bacterium]|jgi:DNA repair photolyase|nr:PA0069 family radical SAM protein [Deltaproteobacteria bacterium]